MSGSSLTSCILHLMFFCWQIFNLVLYQNCHSVRYSCFMENWYPKDLTHDRIILALLLQTDNTNRVSECCSFLNIALPHRWPHLEHFSKHYHFLIHIKPSGLFYNSLACWSVTDRLASLAKPHCHLAVLWTKLFLFTPESSGPEGIISKSTFSPSPPSPKWQRKPMRTNTRSHRNNKSWWSC